MKDFFFEVKKYIQLYTLVPSGLDSQLLKKIEYVNYNPVSNNQIINNESLLLLNKMGFYDIY